MTRGRPGAGDAGRAGARVLGGRRARASFLQLDDVVVAEHAAAGRTPSCASSAWWTWCARATRGPSFDSDVFLIERRRAAGDRLRRPRTCAVTRVEPEVFVPPLPGRDGARARGAERDAGAVLRRHGAPAARWASRATASRCSRTWTSSTARAARTSTSRASRAWRPRPPTPTLPPPQPVHAAARSADAATTRTASIFNVKGEDLLFLDQPNRRLTDAARGEYARLGLPAGPVRDVQLLAPGAARARASGCPTPGAASRVSPSFFWTLARVRVRAAAALPVRRRRGQPSQLSFVVDRVEPRLAGGRSVADRARRRWVAIEGRRVETFDELVDADRGERRRRVGCGRGRRAGTVAAFERRLRGGRAPRGPPDPRRATWAAREHRAGLAAAPDSAVIDIHNLHDRAKRFVVGAVLKRMFEEKEPLGTAAPAGVRGARRAQQVRAARGLRAPSRRSCSTSPSAAAAWASS